MRGVRYDGFVGGQTAAVLGGALSITRSNAATNAAGVYAGVLQPSGLTSDNYAITFEPGTFSIVPSNQLWAEITDQTHVYGSQTPYAVNRVTYFDGVTIFRLDNGSVPGSSVTVSPTNVLVAQDGAGGSATMQLAPDGASTSGAGEVTVGAYQVGVDGLVTESSVNFSDVVTVTGTHTVTRQQLTPSVVGGAAGKWHDPANWQGGAVPDLSNVAHVVIPNGVTITFGTPPVVPAEAGPVNVDGIGNSGMLVMTDGVLNVGTDGVVLQGMEQTGGTLTSAGGITVQTLDQTGGDTTTSGLTVGADFTQSGPGTISVTGNAGLTDNSGGLQLGNLTVGGNLDGTSTDGPITQSGGTVLTVHGTTTLTAAAGIYRSKGFFWLPTRDNLMLLWNQTGGSVRLEIINYWKISALEDDSLNLSAWEETAMRDKLAEAHPDFGDRRCQLTAIGDELELDAFAQALQSCFCTGEEIDAWKRGEDFADPWPNTMATLG